MTPLYDAGRPSEQPQTHVLIIGVNAYPHLGGGALADAEPAPIGFGLEALTSPVVSAVALTDWLLSQHYNPAVPLGSIELLLSPPAYTPSIAAAKKLGVQPGTTLAVDEAKFNLIKAAADRWYVKAHKNCDNIALFYFCGHGLEANERYLLPADFGADVHNWTHNIINFTDTYNNMAQCRAKTQCFFLDACRDGPLELQQQAARSSVGAALVGPLTGPRFERDAPIYHAAAPEQPASGPSNQTSYFAGALLQCLDGMGARPPVDRVYAPVDHNSLGSALRQLIDRIDRGASHPKLRCSSDGDVLLPEPVVLHLAKMPVKVLMIVSCQPSAAHRVARLSVKDSSGTCISRETYEEAPWKLIVTAGTCKVKATFDTGVPYETRTIWNVAFPPLFSLPLEIVARRAAIKRRSSGGAGS